MATFDIVLIAILVVSAILGLLRGFIREIISVVTWVAAFVVASLFAPTLAQYLSDYVKSEYAAHMTAFFVIFVVVWVIGLFVNVLFGSAVGQNGFSTANRLWGALFGIGRGFLIDLLIVFIISNTSLQGSTWYNDSSLAYPLEKICIWLRNDVVNMDKVTPNMGITYN